MKKYEFTGKVKLWFGKTLHQIKAVVAFGEVKQGEIGGWIEKEENLEHSGDAWVYGNACVSGNARVYGNAHWMGIACIGSRNGFTTFFRTKEKKIFVSCGCFSGDIDEFAAKVKRAHGKNEHAKAYMLAIELAKLRIDLSGELPEPPKGE